MSSFQGSSGYRANRDSTVACMATVAFPLKIFNKSKWDKVRKHIIADIPAGWKARRAATYTDGSGALTFSCYDLKSVCNLTPEWIERMTAKVQLISEN